MEKKIESKKVGKVRYSNDRRKLFKQNSFESDKELHWKIVGSSIEWLVNMGSSIQMRPQIPDCG